VGTVKTFKNKLLHLHFALVYVIFRTGFFRLIDELEIYISLFLESSLFASTLIILEKYI